MATTTPGRERAAAPGPRPGDRPWADPALDLEARVAAVVADLGPDEKVALALGDPAPLTARGVPAPHYVDAGSGLRAVDGATAFPAGIALAASYDPGLAERYGAAVGAEAHASGFTVLLGPTLDLARDPRGGRVAEAFGEDPHLAGVIGAAHVRGVQGQHVVAQLKHYVAYNSEERRTGLGPPAQRGDAIDVVVSRATLQDLYLRPFRAAVEAGAWSMMGSYNRVGGRYVCQDPDLLGLPRREWGWRGFFCPDFLFAVRDDAAALAAGLDLPALGGAAGRTAAMVADLPAGRVDEIAGHVVRAMIAVGLVETPPTGPAAGGPSTPEHRHLARAAAVAGTVLLRNRDGLLPLDAGGTVALLGPAGADALVVGGGAAAVTVDRARVVTPLDGLRARLGDRLRHAQGSWGDAPLPPVPPAAFTLPDGSGPGVRLEAGGAVRVVPAIDHAVDLLGGAPWPQRCATLLTSDRTGPHRLSLLVGGRATVRVDGRVVMAGARELERFVAGPTVPLQAVVDLEAGRPALLEVEHDVGPAIAIPPEGLGPTLRLGWQPPDGLLDEAAATAAAADVAVVVVTVAAGEGMDRDGLALPGDQDELVRRVAAANPRTVVVLNAPGPVLMPWLDDVASVLTVWYPGEQYGAALADVLLGDAEPGGRLPVTFPADRSHLPGGDRGPADTPDALRYEEGTGIGYRAPAVREHGALFPFGHGLGYASTTCSVVAGRVEAGSAVLTLEARNASPRAGAHVAQLYAELHGAGERELVAVERFALGAAGGAAGAATRDVVVDAAAFARWDGTARRPVDGRHVLRVSESAADAGHVLEVEVAGGGVVRLLTRTG